MTTEAAARRVPSVPRRNHLSAWERGAAIACRPGRGVTAMVYGAVFTAEASSASCVHSPMCSQLCVFRALCLSINSAHPLVTWPDSWDLSWDQDVMAARVRVCVCAIWKGFIIRNINVKHMKEWICPSKPCLYPFLLYLYIFFSPSEI